MSSKIRYGVQWRQRRKNKVAKGQANLLGDIYQYELKYKPYISKAKTGEAVTVLRLPPDASDFDRRASFEAMIEMSGQVQLNLTKDFWYKAHRDKQRLKELRLLNDVKSTTLFEDI